MYGYDQTASAGYGYQQGHQQSHQQGHQQQSQQSQQGYPGYQQGHQQYAGQQAGHQQYADQHSGQQQGQHGSQHGGQHGGAQTAPPYGQQPDGGQPLYPEPTPPSLQDAVRGFTTGTLTSEDFQSIFSTSKVYCPRGETPGFLALHNTQQPVIPMFTTLKELRAYAGKESRYFVITGSEVLDLLPSGYGFVLDMEGEHRIVFDAQAVEEMVDFAMRRMYG